MDYSQVNPNDPIRFSATQQNAWTAAASANNAKPLKSNGVGSGPIARSPVVVLCKNNDGGNLKSRRAVVLTEPVIDPTDGDAAEAAFKTEVVMKVETPGGDNRLTWGVLTGQLEDQAYGTVVVLGDVICWINLQAKDDLYVDVQADTQIPQSGMYGPGQIVWVSGGVGQADDTGEQWAVIQLGGLSAEAGFWGQITQNAAIDPVSGSTETTTNRWKYTWQEMQYQQNGVFQVRPNGRTTSNAGTDSDGNPITDAYAYNTIETNNSDTGIQGNSIDYDTLPDQMDIEPVRGNPIVWIRPILNCQTPPKTEFVFEYVNAIDGTCPADGSSSSSDEDDS
jgi:hypothetical protein